jgi:hypothetical protein
MCAVHIGGLDPLGTEPATPRDAAKGPVNRKKLAIEL